MRRQVLGFLACVGTVLLCAVGWCESPGDAGAVTVGTTRQVFLDDYVVGETKSVRRVLHAAVRHSGNPVVAPDRPWEGKILEGPTVFWDATLGRFRMYYWAIYSPEVIYTCYAESEDGIDWRKPTLGLCEGPDGGKQNNIVLRGEGKQARTRYVALNPYSTDPERRYVALYIDNVPGLTEFAAYSPDGLHWKTIAKIGDLRNTTGAAPTPNPAFFLLEQRWDPTPSHRCRAIWRTESADLVHWSGGTWALQRMESDPTEMEFYHATSHFLGRQTYDGLHLGYYYPFRTFAEGKKLPDGTRLAGTVDTALMVSRDTIHWQRVAGTQPLLARAPDGSWDGGMVYMHPELVVDRRLRFYYSGWQYEHSMEGKNSAAIGLATLRLDGFVSLEPEETEGIVTTKPFRLEGTRLVVNANTRGGKVRVGVLDEGGQPLGGFEVGRAAALADEDGLDLPCRWEGQASLKTIRGQTVRLQFELTRSKLYAFEVLP